jgi:hypothetical protein
MMDKQMRWYWKMKAKKERTIFYKEFEKKKMPIERLTVAGVRDRIPGNTIAHDILSNINGITRIKNLALKDEHSYEVFHQINKDIIPMLLEGPKEWIR